jgi:peptide/nickel transport system substrate-binding protein
MEARRLLVILLLVVSLLVGLAPAPVAAQAQMTWAVHISLAPTWFDPGEHTGNITLMMVLYAVHDAMIKPMPGNATAPSLAESWTAARDGLSYEFVLRKGVVFHNGDAFTAEDVKFSFERYRGAAARLLKDKVAAVEVVDPFRVRFRLKEPWPDFMTFYASPATGAGWIVPKKYIEKVGEDGFRKAPVGAGPYRLTAFNPGVDLVLEAHDRYWRKSPTVKRLVWKVVPEDITRMAMLKRGEVDIAYSLRGPLGE